MARALFLILGLLLASFASAESKERTILPGDLIRISSANQELCVSRIVNEDGMISLPLVGAVAVATMKPREIEGKIRAILADGSIEGGATVTPQFLPHQPIEVAGTVKRVLKMRFAHSVSLSDVMEIAEPLELADTGAVEISHADGSFETANIDAPFWLIDGDRVTVPHASSGRVVQVVGGVVKPTQINLRGKLTLADALEAAGGIAARSDRGRIALIRNGEAQPLQLPDDAGFVLLAGDTVKVEVKEVISHVVVQGDVTRPGLVDFTPGMKLTQALLASGGVAENSRTDLVCLKREVEGAPKTVKLSLRYIRTHRIPDPVLSENDIIEVGNPSPSKRR